MDRDYRAREGDVGGAQPLAGLKETECHPILSHGHPAWSFGSVDRLSEDRPYHPGVNSDVGLDLIFGAVFTTGGSLLAFNIARARDRYTSFLARPDIPRAWKRSRIDQPRFARAYGFMFLAAGVLLLLLAFLRLLGR
jgi:hypothetical protein